VEHKRVGLGFERDTARNEKKEALTERSEELMADKYIPIVYVPSDWIKDPKISSQISTKVMKIKEHSDDD